MINTKAIYELIQSNIETREITHALEHGQVIYIPKNSFTLKPHESSILDEGILKPKVKNVSFDIHQQTLSGMHQKYTNTPTRAYTHQVMQRFAEYSQKLIDELFPNYKEELVWGRTSYRPAEIKGRRTSKLKDDTKLHVDAFASTPVHGFRILRVFCNINPNQIPRVWHLGEGFEDVLKQFKDRLPVYKPSIAKLLHGLKITKSRRSSYDHYMLKLHNHMKLDSHYQNKVNPERIDFPAQSTWIAFTDVVSHAALSGQHLLEQTFYLPVHAMAHPEQAPIAKLKRVKKDITESWA
jgi:hypothetical protein